MAATVRSSSKNNGSSAAASWTVPMPTGAVTGDVVYVTVIMLNISSGRTASVSSPTFATLRNNDVMSGNTKTSLFRRVLDGSEGATITGAFAGGGGNNWTAIAVCVQGADNTTPEDATVTATLGGASSVSHVCPTITAVGSDDLWLGMAAGNSNSGTYTWPTPPTELQDGGSTGCISMANESLSSSGAVGTRTATRSAAAVFSTYSILVRSASVAATPSRVTGVASVPSVVVQTNPEAVRVTAVAAVPAVVAKVSATPTRVDAVASVPNVNVVIGQFVTPTRVTGVAAVPAVGVSVTTIPTRVDAVASVPAPIVVVRATPTRVDAVASVNAPSMSLTVGPTRVTGVAAVPAVTVISGTLVTRVTALAIIPAPTLLLRVLPTRVTAVAYIGLATIDVENGSTRIPRVDIAAASHAVDRLPLPPYDPTRTPPATVAEVPYRPGGENY